MDVVPMYGMDMEEGGGGGELGTLPVFDIAIEAIHQHIAVCVHGFSFFLSSFLLRYSILDPPISALELESIKIHM